MTSKRSRKSRNAARPGIAIETLIWHGIKIEVAYEADWLGSSEGPDPLSHLGITSVEPAKAPLPFTETGYRSHFIEPGTVEQAGGPASFVSAWLEEASTSRAWRRYEAESRQLSLF